MMAMFSKKPQLRHAIVLLGLILTLLAPWDSRVDAAAPFASIAVFDDPAYVDTGGGIGDESDTVQASLTSLGHTVTPFAGISDAAFSAALAGQDILLIPELETGNLGAALTPAAVTVIADFVSSGGGLIVHGCFNSSDAAFLNNVFGFSMTSTFWSFGPISLAPGSVGSAFEGGPDPLPDNSATSSIDTGLPAGSSIIYGDAGNAVVAIIPHGLGKIIYIGWDWFNAAPLGSEDGGWLAVLDNAVHEMLPYAADDAGPGYETDEDTPFTTGDVLENDTGPDGDPLTVDSFDDSGTSGEVSYNGDGTFDYDPDGQFEYLAVGESDTDSFEYTVTDGNGGFATATVTITITGVNDPPTAVDDTETTDEDTPLEDIIVLDDDTDPDTSDVLTVESFDDTGTAGVVTLNPDDTFDYDPDGQFEWMCEGWTETDTFEYTVTDEYGATDDATVTITINGVNDAPTPDDDEYDTTEDTIRTVAAPGILIGDTDPDDCYTLEVVEVNTSDTVGLVNYNAEGWINYDPDGQFEYLAVGETETDSFTYTVEDDHGATASATVTITIHGVNDAPTAVDDTAETDEDTPLASIIVLDDDTDPDTSDVLTVDSFDTSGTAGAVTLNPDGTFDYDPDGEFEYLAVGESGTDSFEYTVTDGNGGFDTATVTITIHGVNDPPTAVDDTETTDEDTLLEDIIVLDDDTDPDDSDVLTVESFDDTGTVGAVTLTGDTFDYDPVGAFDNLPDGAEATDIFTYTVSDGHGGTDDATVTITVEGVNDPPVGVDDVYNTDEDTDLTVEAPGVLENDTDPDEGYALEVSGVDDSSLIGTLDMLPVVDGSFYYTPTDQFQYLGRSETVTETFTYTVTDDLLEEDSATVSIAIAGVNDAPTAGDDTANTLEETPRTIAVLGNDNDPDTSDTLFVAIVGPPTNGDASTNGTTVTYTPTQDFSGADVFTYTVSDGELTDIAQVDILVGATNDPPNAEYNTVTTKEDTLVKLNVLDNDSDPDGDSIMVVALGQPQHGAATYNGPTVTYTPTLNFNGNDVFTYTISDGELTDTAEIEVVVESVNDPPTISAILDQYTDMNEPVGPISFTIGDVETPVGDLALSSASSNTDLVPVSAIHINRAGANCTLTINPTLFMWGTSTITLTVSDGTAHTSEEFMLTVIEGPVEYIYLPHIFKPYLPPGAKP